MAMQYIGARYVPTFYVNPDDGSTNWKANVTYEALTIVTYNGDSYTSKKAVPNGIGNPADNHEYWVKTGDFNASLLELQNRVNRIDTLVGNEPLETEANTISGAVNELNTAVKTAFITPQYYGAKGDGITDDTEAFREMANENIGKYIPYGTYVINEEIILDNVIKDDGVYTNYKPMYSKKLSIPVQAVAWIRKNIPLNGSNEYEESMVKIADKYYVITNEFSNNTNGIIVYDSNFEIVSHVSHAKTTIGTCNSCCTDGTYLYIDYDNGYHRKYDPSDLTTPLLEISTAYRNTCYYNNSLYAVIINSDNVRIGKLNAEMTTISDSWSIPYDEYVMQSSMIFDGVLYILTLGGMYTAVDLVTHEVLNVPANTEPFEIEAFYEDDGKLYCVGQQQAVGGVMNIGSFDFGISEPAIHVIEVDANVERFSPTTVAQRTNIYHVVNGNTAGVLPMDDCVVQWVDKNLICYSVAQNGKYYYFQNAWHFMGVYTPIIIDVDGSSLQVVLQRDGGVYVYCRSYRYQETGTANSKSFNVDLSAIFDKVGWSASTNRETLGISRGYGAITNTGLDVYAFDILVQKTSVQVSVRALLGIASNVDTLLIGTFRIDV